MGPALKGISSRDQIAYLLPLAAIDVEVGNELMMLFVRPKVSLTHFAALGLKQAGLARLRRWGVSEGLLAFEVDVAFD